jgi:hypothetical protein
MRTRKVIIELTCLLVHVVRSLKCQPALSTSCDKQQGFAAAGIHITLV